MRCVWEHNGDDTLLYSVDHIGAFTRGESLAIAMNKMHREVESYQAWLGKPLPRVQEIVIVQEKASDLQIRDADSDVIFSTRRTRFLLRNIRG